jgi:small-conductance mechanosensitive channel
VPELESWFTWGGSLGFTVIVLAVSYALGQVLGLIATKWIPRALPERQRALAESIGGILRRRVPTWSLLVGLWLAAGSWPITPETHVLIEKVLFVLGALSVTMAIAAIASRSVDAYSSLIVPALPVTSLTRNIVSAVISVLGLLVILNGLGLSITPMLTALGVGGLAVALALQEPLGNFFAGLFLTLAGQIRVGDYVKLDSGEEGYVVDFSWRSTRLRMLANNLIVVPNAKLAQAIMVNHHLPSEECAVLVQVGVDYASDLGHVERVAIDVGREVMSSVPGGVAEFEPFVRFHTFGESSVDFTMILRARQFVDQYLVKHEFIKRLHARFDAEGIVIPFPIVTVDRRAPAGGAEGAAGEAG